MENKSSLKTNEVQQDEDEIKRIIIFNKKLAELKKHGISLYHYLFNDAIPVNFEDEVKDDSQKTEI